MTVQSLGQEDPLEEERQLAPVFFPGKFHGRRSLAVYSPWGCKVWDRTGRAGTPAHHHTMLPVISIICSSSSSASVWILSTLFTVVTKGLAHSSVTQSCLTLCGPMDCSTPGLPVHHQLLEPTQTHVHRVGGAIQTSHPLSSSSPPTFNLSQHQGVFQ